MDPAVHRRIELQAPEDLIYLTGNVRRAAQDSINAAFPPVDKALDGQESEDELRNRIEQLVNDYITKTFALAAPNLTINGLPVDPSQFLTDPLAGTSAAEYVEYEPFDGRKRDRIEALISEEEDLLRSIAQLKRRAPRATAARWAEATCAGLAADEAALAAACERAADEGSAAGRRAVEGMGELERQAEMEGSFQGAVEALGRLKREMPAAVAKMERARVAAGYVTGGR